MSLLPHLPAVMQRENDRMSFQGLVNNVSKLANKLFAGEIRDRCSFFPKDRIALNQTVSDWCLRNAAFCIERQAMEEALQWDVLAARIMSFDCAVLTSPELEKQLIQIGTWIRTPISNQQNNKSQPKRWLHVLTEVYPDGGHGTMVRRWIQLDPQENSHSVALLAQKKPVPESLTETVRMSGGAMVQMDPGETLVSRATQLRELVWTHADVVVLHTHPWDVIATVALGVPGGPPVLLLNHAAHVFWVGCSIADVIINIRHSKDEDDWTVRYRGIDRIMHLPIPLPEPPHSDSPVRRSREARRDARNALGVPVDAIVLLTVGNDYKYNPVQGLDFLKTAESILSQHEGAYLLAAGPKEDKRWRTLREKTGGRALAFGVQKDVGVFHAAADVYLEGFPFGSTTSLLEAGVKGIPCVLPPRMCPPPFVTDGVSVLPLEQAVSNADYIRRVLMLLTDEQERQHQGELICKNIRNHNCSKGWQRYLLEIQHNIPSAHKVYPLLDQPPVDDFFANYWAAFSHALNENPLALVVNQALPMSLETATDNDYFELMLLVNDKCSNSEISNCLRIVGDYNCHSNEYDKALEYYECAIKYDPLALKTIIKYILLSMGYPGIKLTNGIRRIKSYVES